jgi:hypothetical protein
MQTLLFIISAVASAAFVFAVMFGKPSKDEPLKPPVLDEWENFYHKDWKKEF